ncbi:MAG: hypothetical protein MUF13_01975, partial [Akkermansiaceae bacterium]|nr:hypothetical protein [Akkermansiaceae bacterium]
MKKVFTSAIALSFSLSVFAQTSTSESSPVYAQASEVASPQIDLTSNDVTRKYFNTNREEVKSLDGARFIQISKKNSKGSWDVAEFFA